MKTFWSVFPRTAVLLVALSVSACAFNPVKAVQSRCPHCQPLHLTTEAELQLKAYATNFEQLASAEFIHVYLEGDGQPWIRGRWPAKNPSSYQMTALNLMLLDPNPSIYLNRPCYGYKVMPESCTETLWTNARYGSEVVDSMVLGLTELSHRYPGKRWVLIGHSGGGTLAMLLAGRVDNIVAVVTLAANLDHRAWTQVKGYTPLNGSLNPVDQPPLSADIIRWHFAGAEDHQVPAHITASAADQDSLARYALRPEFDHSCCWQTLWSSILEQLDNQLTGTK